MAREKIEVIYEFVDRGSSGVTSAVAGLGKLGATAAKTAAVGLAAVGTAAVLTGAKLLSLGSDAAEMQSKFSIVFANVGGDVTKQLNEFSKATGLSRFELQSMAATLGDTFQPMGFTESAAADMSVTMTKLAADLASFNNISMDEALQRLQGTLIGSHENALAFGVVITDTVLKQELARIGADKLTGAQFEAAKVQARYNLLLKGTESAQTDAIRTSQGWANQMKALNGVITDTATVMGLAMLPIFEPMLQAIVRLANSALPALADRFQFFVNIITRFQERGKEGMEITKNLRIAFRNLANMFGFAGVKAAAFASVVASIGIASSRVVKVILKEWKKGFILFEDGSGSIMDILEAFGLAERRAQLFGIALYDALSGNLLIFEDGSGTVMDFFEAIGLTANAAQEMGIKAYDMGVIIGDLWTTIQPGIQFITDLVSQFFSWQDILGAVGGVITSSILGALASLLGSLISIAAPVIGLIAVSAALRAAWRTDWGGIRSAVTEAWDTYIAPRLSTLIEWFQTNIPAAIETLKGFWNETLLPIFTALGEVYERDVKPRLEALGVLLGTILLESITMLTAYWNENFMPALLGLWTFLTEDMNPVWEALAELLSVVLKQAWDLLLVAFDDALIKGKLLWEAIKDNVLPILKQLGTFISERLTGWFHNFTESLGGANSAISALVGWIGKLSSAVNSLDMSKLWALIGQSPSPLERGITGANKAMSEFTGRQLPALSSGLQAVESTTTNTVNNFTLNMTSNAQSENVANDFGMMASAMGGI